MNHVTIGDIAKDAGVSISTVSRVLNGNDRVSEEKRMRVQSSISRYHYHPSLVARTMITKRSEMIAVVEADARNPGTIRIIEEINQYCTENQQFLVICDYQQDAKRAQQILDSLLERNIDGLVFMGIQFDDQLLNKLKRFQCPVVLAQQEPEKDHTFSTLIDDSYHGMRSVVSVLADAGHRKIAFIGGNENDFSNGKERYRGYIDEMKHQGLDIPSAYVEQTEFTMHGGWSGMKKIYEESSTLPTAVACGSDLIAAGCIRFLRSYGMKVPDDISVFGYDDSVDDLFEVPLSTVRSYDRGRLICEQLFRQMNGEINPKRIVYPYKVIRRMSTRRLK